MTGTQALILMAALLIKHYIADFPTQRPFMYMNKGRYGAWGGIAHAGVHAIGTAAVLVLLFGSVGLWLAALDGLLHYHIDWAKVNLGKSRGWSEYITDTTVVALTAGAEGRFPLKHTPPHLAIYSDMYFQALGLDQLAHAMTYVLLVVLVL